MAESRQMSRGDTVRARRQLVFCAWTVWWTLGARPVLNTKIILYKSGTVGACLVLRQRVCVTGPLFTKMPNCISPTLDRKTALTNWPGWRPKKVQMLFGWTCFPHIYYIIESFMLTFGKSHWKFRCTAQILLRRYVYLSTVCLAKEP